MRLVYPTIEYKEKAIDYINEFYKYNSDINGTGGLDRFLKESSYEEWLKFLVIDKDFNNIKDGRSPALTFFYVDDNDNIIGMTNIRIVHTKFLMEEAGNIGYSIRPTKRRKHYGIDLLRLALEVLKKNGLKEAYISCNKENIASKGLILKSGGMFHHEVFSNKFNELIEMYVIKL